MSMMETIAKTHGLFLPRQKVEQEEIYGALTNILSPGSTGVSRPETIATFEDMERAYGQRVWVYACVYTIAASGASVPVRLCKKMSRAGFREIEKHPILDILAGPNPFQSGFEFQEMCWIYAEATGNVYIHIEVDRDGKTPIELYPLRPSRIKVVPDKESKVGGYIYSVGHEEIALDRDEVIHFKYPNPNNDYYGLAPILSVVDAVDTHSYATKYTRNFFKNDATPGGVLTTDDELDGGVIQRLQKQWEQLHGKYSQAHKIAILHSGLKYQKVSAGIRELALTEIKDASRKEIQAAFGVPDIYMQATLESSALGESTAQAQMRTFWTETMVPKLRKFWGGPKVFGVMTTEFAQRFDPDLVLLPDYADVEPLQEAISERFNRAKEGVAGTLMSPNEGRAEIGLEAIDSEEADNIYRDTPLGPVLVGTAPRPKHFLPYRRKVLDAPEWADDITSLSEDIPARQAVTGKVDSEPVYERVNKLLWELKEAGAEPPVGDQERLEAFLKQHETEENELFKEFKAVFGDQEKRVLEALERRLVLAAGVVKAPNVDPLLPDWDKENTILADAMAESYKALYAAAGQELLDRMGYRIDFDLLNPLVAEAIDRRLVWWADEVNQVTLEHLRKALAEGIEAGETIEELRARVQEVFSGLVRGEADRSRLIARTETTGIMNGAENLAAELAEDELEVYLKKRWLTAMDTKVRDSHIAAGLLPPIPVKEAFVLEGGKLLYPGDGSLDADASELCNCRCTVIYEEEEE